MRLTNIQLITAAHHAARYLPKASAEMVMELATRLDVSLVALREMTKQRDALAAMQQQGIRKALDECTEYLDRDCIMETNGISYEDAAQREVGAMALHDALLRQDAAR